MPREKWKMDYLVAIVEHFQTIKGDVALSEIFDGASQVTNNLFQNSLSRQAGSIIVPASVLKKLVRDLPNCDYIRDVYRVFNAFIQKATEGHSSETDGICKLVLANLGRIFGPATDKMIQGPIPSAADDDDD